MKKTIATITMAMVMIFGATFAHAGIIVGDRAGNVCDNGSKDGIIVFGARVGTRDGIIVFGSATGIIVFGATTGIIVFGSKTEETPCTQNTGIIVGD